MLENSINIQTHTDMRVYIQHTHSHVHGPTLFCIQAALPCAFWNLNLRAHKFPRAEGKPCCPTVPGGRGIFEVSIPAALQTSSKLNVTMTGGSRSPWGGGV